MDEPSAGLVLVLDRRPHVVRQRGLVRSVGVVGRQEIADLDPVLVVQGDRGLDQLVVDVGLVAALEVFDDVLAVDERKSARGRG